MANTKICIVEDEILIAMDIANSLKEFGYDVTDIATNYTTAIEIIERDKPDIVLLDIQLDGHLDGIDLAGKIKKDYELPFIFITANADTATFERAKQTLASAYLVKPFKAKDIYTSIELALYNFCQNKNAKSE